MIDDARALVRNVVTRMPRWIRQDLLARDDSARDRAEDALVAMIADALERDRRAPGAEPGRS